MKQNTKIRAATIRNQSPKSIQDTKTWENSSFSQRLPNDPPAWAGRTLKVLLAFADEARAPCISEVTKLLRGQQTSQVTLVDVSASDMSKAHRWSPEVQTPLFHISKGQFDVVWITLPTQGMSRTLFANTNGPSPQRSRRYPFGFPWLLSLQQRGGSPGVCIRSYDSERHF